MANQPDPRLQYLANRWLKGTLSEEEQQEFDAWFRQSGNEPQRVPDEFGNNAAEQRERLFAQIRSQIHQPAKIRRLWPRIAAAASILFILSFGAVYLIHKQPAQQVAQVHDIK